jgi:hypothetical protein
MYKQFCVVVLQLSYLIYNYTAYVLFHFLNQLTGFISVYIKKTSGFYIFQIFYLHILVNIKIMLGFWEVGMND